VSRPEGQFVVGERSQRFGDGGMVQLVQPNRLIRTDTVRDQPERRATTHWRGIPAGGARTSVPSKR
jgi:hypothetical protein